MLWTWRTTASLASLMLLRGKGVERREERGLSGDDIRICSPLFWIQEGRFLGGRGLSFSGNA